MTEEFSPGEKKKFLGWMKEESRLQKQGAQFDARGRLHLTPAQVRKARIEMLVEKRGELIKQREFVSNPNFEVTETKTFDVKSIINIIARAEGLSAQDFFVVQGITDKRGALIFLSLELKPEIALERFGRIAQYHFESKSFDRLSNSALALFTKIDRFFESGEWDLVKTEYDSQVEGITDNDREYLAGLSPEEKLKYMLGENYDLARRAQAGPLLVFNGKNWNKATKK